MEFSYNNFIELKKELQKFPLEIVFEDKQWSTTETALFILASPWIIPGAFVAHLWALNREYLHHDYAYHTGMPLVAIFWPITLPYVIYDSIYYFNYKNILNEHKFKKNQLQLKIDNDIKRKEIVNKLLELKQIYMKLIDDTNSETDICQKCGKNQLVSCLKKYNTITKPVYECYDCNFLNFC